MTRDLTYESTNPVLTPDALDVYAPAKAGPWPVVVMFHGAPGSDPATDRGYLSENARRVAELGFVVFNASWGHAPGGRRHAHGTTASWRSSPRPPVRSSSPGRTRPSTAATRRR